MRKRGCPKYGNTDLTSSVSRGGFCANEAFTEIVCNECGEKYTEWYKLLRRYDRTTTELSKNILLNR